MLEQVTDTLDQVRIEHRDYWIRADFVEGLTATAPLPPGRVVRLLPAFDPWVVAGNRQGRPGVGNPTLDEAHRSRVHRRQGWVSAVVTIDGRIAGTWSYRVRGSCLSVELQPFSPWEDAVGSAIEAEIDRLREFLGADSSRVSVSR